MGLKVVRTFDTLWEAGMAKSILEGEGIQAVVEEALAQVMGYIPPCSGARLLVNEEDLRSAEEALRRWDESNKLPDESADSEDQKAASERDAQARAPVPPRPDDAQAGAPVPPRPALAELAAREDIQRVAQPPWAGHPGSDETNRLHVESELARHGRRIDAVLEELVPRSEPAFLAEAAWYHLETGGKRIRPALCLLTCEALGGDSEKALYFAAAVELLHNMLLIHDDIEDGDTVRRNKPTVWRAYGAANAINVGDYLFARSLRAVTLSPVPEAVRGRLLGVFLTTYERTIAGQALDINSRSAARFSVEEYLRMAALKTGHYLALGMIGGAMIADAPEATLECLRKLGDSLGPAFQVRDDVLDLTEGKGRGGMKGSDIREGKASILYAHALARCPPAEAERLVGIMKKPREETTEEDAAEVIGLYRQCGSIAFAEETAERLIREAQRTLDGLPIEQRPVFREILACIAERTT